MSTSYPLIVALVYGCSAYLTVAFPPISPTIRFPYSSPSLSSSSRGTEESNMMNKSISWSPESHVNLPMEPTMTESSPETVFDTLRSCWTKRFTRSVSSCDGLIFLRTSFWISMRLICRGGIYRLFLYTTNCFNSFMTAVVVFFTGLILTQFKSYDISIKIPVAYPFRRHDVGIHRHLPASAVDTAGYQRHNHGRIPAHSDAPFLARRLCHIPIFKLFPAR